MSDRFKPLLDRRFLRSELHYEYEDYKQTGADAPLLERLRSWDERRLQGEREIEAAFIQRFFVETWGYGDAGGSASWTLQQQFVVAAAGPGGAAGSADLALGHFGEGGTPTPQVLCEFKGVSAELDRPQRRKGLLRTPVDQGLDYLRAARRGLFGTEPVLPRFAIITNMNEFRLYWWDTAPDRYLRFRISGGDLLDAAGGGTTMLSDNDEAQFDRFLFWYLLRPAMLISRFGRPRMEALVQKQGTSERRLEKDFYQEYRSYRNLLFSVIRTERSVAHLTDTEKLRLTQKLLDRLIFIMFAEDMGMRVAFPMNILRDQLKQESLDRFYRPNGTRVWEILCILFRAMNEGGEIGDSQIHRFNGGLFEADTELDALALPNYVFCKKGQGRNPASIEGEKETLLYFAATYNFASEGDADSSIGLYTLGHIFEQSIDDLEVLEAEIEGRESITELSGKRKREGIYYTPEPIVRRIVEETISPLFEKWRAEAGWPSMAEPSRDAADAYWARLEKITVVDPACGSGAFLITALRYLLAEFRTAMEARRRVNRAAPLYEEHELIDRILAKNLHGVDINPASVEISKLSLWLHTARAQRPLSSLDGRVVVGNSLIDQRFTAWPPAADLSAEVRERMAAFDWQTAFPEVWENGGFDAVIGNPPYVKLQNFRRVYAETAEYLRSEHSHYRSTKTGNYDLYLPFIERGLELLNPNGRLGYIAPSLWPSLEHGEGLRNIIREGGHLEKWIDFRSHQVFPGLTTYTAIQIYSKMNNGEFLVAFAPKGDIGRIEWTTDGAAIPYPELPTDGGEWLIAPERIRRLAARLASECRRLDDPEVTSAIFQGLITSADYIYHLKRLGRNRYLHTPRKVGQVQPPPFEVSIEDEIMRPLVSGPEAKRFIDPTTETYILFPYHVSPSSARLWSQREMAAKYPNAWAYLKKFQRELRARESDAFDDSTWYRFGRPQNLDKQENKKLLVAQIVPQLRVCNDREGKFYVNNVRVNGIIPLVDPWFLLGILNSRTTDVLFRWRGKPKANNYYEANKQFIAPLPVPFASEGDEAAVAACAEALQRGYSRRMVVIEMLEERLATTSRRKRPCEWLLPDVRPAADIEADAPRAMPRGDRPAWATERYKEEVTAALDRVDSMIQPASEFEALLEEGKLRFLVDGSEAARVFVDEAWGPFILSQWQNVALTFQPKGKDDGKRLVDRLRSTSLSAEPAVRSQVIDRQAELSTLTAELRRKEEELHRLTSTLFGLTATERSLVMSS